MENHPRLLCLIVTIAAMCASWSIPAVAADPQKLALPAFDVQVTDGSGNERESFTSSNPPHFKMRFALALSASDNYSTKITLIRDGAGKIEESVLFEGILSEGNYEFLAPAGRPIVNSGSVTAKIIFKIRVFPKKFTGESFYTYRRWEGTYRIGS